LVSATRSELNYAVKGYDSGTVDFLHKPLDTKAVISKIAVGALSAPANNRAICNARPWMSCSLQPAGVISLL